MAIVFDSTQKRIVLDTATITATEIYSRWVDWLSVSDNSKFLPAFRSVGGDDLGDGISIPAYFFLQNGWRVRPMEATHTLTVTGNLFVDGGGDPIVPTIGNFNVLIRSVVPVQAQTVNISGGSGGASLAEIENSAILAKQATLLETKVIAEHVGDYVWNVPIAILTDSTTIGGYIGKKVLSVAKFIGLK